MGQMMLLIVSTSVFPQTSNIHKYCTRLVSGDGDYMRFTQMRAESKKGGCLQSLY